MTGLASLQHAVTERLLSGTDEPIMTLKHQYRRASTSPPEQTGSGFIVRFEVPPEVPRLPLKPSFTFGDIMAQIPGLHFGAGFMLTVRDGALASLEGYSFEEPWPENIGSFTLSQDPGLAAKKRQQFKALQASNRVAS